MDSVITISALGDNFIYLYQYDQTNALAVDPCVSSLVTDVIEHRHLNLAAIFATHHHWDHTAGIAELKDKTGCSVFGGDKRIPGIDHIVEDGRILTFGDKKIHVIATPGHTTTSLCYYILPSQINDGIVFTGDTLFAGGCGRLFEGDAQSMFDSLGKLASLPDNTLVYCGHEYTVENYQFALTIEPDNQTLKQRLLQVRHLKETGKPTVPSTILQERTTNPFLRTSQPTLQAAINMTQAKPAEVLAQLRKRKDIF